MLIWNEMEGTVLRLTYCTLMVSPDYYIGTDSPGERAGPDCYSSTGQMAGVCGDRQPWGEGRARLLQQHRTDDRCLWRQTALGRGQVQIATAAQDRWQVLAETDSPGGEGRARLLQQDRTDGMCLWRQTALRRGRARLLQQHRTDGKCLWRQSALERGQGQIATAAQDRWQVFVETDWVRVRGQSGQSQEPARTPTGQCCQSLSSEFTPFYCIYI